jgi:hypothetical protein
MPYYPKPDAHRRAIRIQLKELVPAVITLEQGQRTKAKVQTVSVNGGLLQVAQAVREGGLVEVAFETPSGPVQGMAEMLPPQTSGNAVLQAFRFVALDDHAHRALTVAVTSISDWGFLFAARGVGRN